MKKAKQLAAVLCLIVFIIMPNVRAYDDDEETVVPVNQPGTPVPEQGTTQPGNGQGGQQGITQPDNGQGGQQGITQPDNGQGDEQATTHSNNGQGGQQGITQPDNGQGGQQGIALIQQGLTLLLNDLPGRQQGITQPDNGQGGQRGIALVQQGLTLLLNDLLARQQETTQPDNGQSSEQGLLTTPGEETTSHHIDLDNATTQESTWHDGSVSKSHSTAQDVTGQTKEFDGTTQDGSSQTTPGTRQATRSSTPLHSSSQNTREDTNTLPTTSATTSNCTLILRQCNIPINGTNVADATLKMEIILKNYLHDDCTGLFGREAYCDVKCHNESSHDIKNRRRRRADDRYAGDPTIFATEENGDLIFEISYPGRTKNETHAIILGYLSEIATRFGIRPDQIRTDPEFDVQSSGLNACPAIDNSWKTGFWIVLICLILTNVAWCLFCLCIILAKCWRARHPEDRLLPYEEKGTCNSAFALNPTPEDEIRKDDASTQPSPIKQPDVMPNGYHPRLINDDEGRIIPMNQLSELNDNETLKLERESTKF